MALSINTNTAALSAYQNLAAQSARQDEALSTASAAASTTPQVADTVQFAHANAEAAASAMTVDDADMAAQITHLAAAQIGANVAAALVAQANSSPDTVLSLLQ